MKCVIIDDEQHAIDVLKFYTDKIPDLDVLQTFINPIDAIVFLNSTPVDLVFLDINMSNISGFEFLKIYNKGNIVLTTAYSDYAINSYEYDVIDYLLKPFSFERFVASYQKTLNRSNNNSLNQDSSHYSDFLFLKTDRDKMIKVDFEQIIYVEGLKNYICVHTISGQIITLLNMKDIEKYLPYQKFIRVQRSFIVNMNFVNSIEGNKIILSNTNNTIIQLGITYRENFMKYLDSFMIKGSGN